MLSMPLANLSDWNESPSDLLHLRSIRPFLLRHKPASTNGEIIIKLPTKATAALGLNEHQIPRQKVAKASSLKIRALQKSR